MKWLQRFDPIFAAIFALLLLLAGLLTFLLTIDREVERFRSDETAVQRMMRLDRSFDNFLLRKIEAINYETINDRMERFETILERFARRPIDREYGPAVRKTLEKIETAYRKKQERIERFKSYNAEAINTLHYLFDLRKSLVNDPHLDQRIQMGLDSAFFDLMQFTMGVTESPRQALKTLARLRQETASISCPNLERFFRTAETFAKTVQRLKTVRAEAAAIPLAATVQTLRRQLEASYNRQIRIEKGIALFLFLLTFGALLTAAYFYHTTKKAYKRLKAFMYAVENSDNTVVMTDVNRRITYVNEAFEKGSGYSRDEAIGQNPRILKSGLQDESFYAEMNRTLNRGEKWEGIFINKRKDGSLYYEKASIVPIRIDGELTGYLAIKLDITQFVEQQQKLKLSAAVFENAQESILITDADGRILSVNHSFTAITGYSEEEVKGKTPSLLKSGMHDEEFYRRMWHSITQTGQWHGKIYNRAKNGEIIPMWLTITALYDEKGNVLNYIGMQTDLREIIENQEKAEYLAYHDILTGLPNRAYFEERLFRTIEVAKRNETILAVLFIDLDRFKIINDTLGHDIGDLLLKEVADRIKATLRKSDMLARLGGDEFVAVLETIRNAEDAAHVSEKILEALTEPFRIGSHTFNVTASIGIALFPDNGETIVDLIKNADNAMYLAKNMGKNNYQFYMPELSRQIRRRLAIEQGLGKAKLEEEFWLAYQPQYRIDDHSVYGAEVLLRWESPDLGIVPPDEFISVAEETGKINRIGLFVFEKACETLRKLDEMGIHLDSISVNVSSKQFLDRELPQTFLRIAESHGIEPQRVILEMTERYIMDTSSYDDQMLQTFRSMGFRISVDDFGTGYSSMSYLKTLPIDTIKIDKSFIQDIPEDANDREITKAIIALSKSLGYKVVAEGIEHEEQEAFLLEHGCRYGQGYLFARPLDEEKFFDFLKKRK